MLLNKLFKKLTFFFIRYFPLLSSIIYMLYFSLVIYNYINNIYYEINYTKGIEYYYVDLDLYNIIIYITISKFNIIPIISASFGFKFCLYHKLLILHSFIAILLFNITITSNILFLITAIFIVLSFPYLFLVYKIKKKYGIYKK